MSDDERILISGRVGGPSDRLRAPGSIQGKCMKCSHPVWLAPTSLPLPIKGIVCTVCVNVDQDILAAVARGDILHVEGQKKEFEDTTGERMPTKEEIMRHYKKKLKKQKKPR